MDVAHLRDSAAPAPLHVAVIMDGNGRWARARGLPRTAGHRRGAKAKSQLTGMSEVLDSPFITLRSEASDRKIASTSAHSIEGSRISRRTAMSPINGSPPPGADCPSVQVIGSPSPGAGPT